MLVPIWVAFEALAGGETCPAAVDVEARVRAILHLPAERPLSESFLVERHESGLYVELRGADASVIGQRTLPKSESCDELAQAAAVVLAAWLSDVHPDFAAALPPPLAEPAPTEPAAQPAPPRAPISEAPTLHHPTGAEPRPPAAPTTAAYRWQLALSLGADYAATKLALAGAASLALLPSESGWGASLVAIPSASRSQPLGPGAFDWRRWPLAVGPTYRFQLEPLVVEGTVGPALAWLHFAGSVFDRNFQPDGLAWGGLASLRVAAGGRRWAVLGWLDAQYYPVKAKVYASNVAPDWSVPSWSFGAFAGVGYSL